MKQLKKQTQAQTQKNTKKQKIAGLKKMAEKISPEQEPQKISDCVSQEWSSARPRPRHQDVKREHDDLDLREIEASFKLGIGTDIDKMLAVVTGNYKCPSLPGETAKITKSIIAPGELYRKILSRKYKELLGSDIDTIGIPNEILDSTQSDKYGKGRIIVNIPEGWNVTINEGKVVIAQQL